MKLFRKIKYFKFIYTKSRDRLDFFSDREAELLIITIAFNNSEFIKHQIQLIKKYIEGDFVHCVIDNSSELKFRKKIKEVCLESSISYYSIPENPYRNNKSHAAAMHWAFFQIIKNYPCVKFGFLDHDIFPITNFSFSGRFKYGIYGRVIHSYFQGGYNLDYSKNIPYWSLWAGFCFFEKKVIKGGFPWSFNFFSKHFKGGFFLDTGGGLWSSLYSKMDYPGDLVIYQKKYYDNMETEEMQNQSFEILDDAWIHFVSLSNWRETRDLEWKKHKLIDFLSEHI